MQRSLDQAGSKFQSIGTKLTAGISLPLAAAAGVATKFAADFETSTTKLVTLSGVSEQQMKKMRQAVLDLAPTVGIGPNALSEALLVVTSTGFEGAQAMEILATAAKSSAVGMGDTKDVARALTAAISAYGAENLTAARAGDILHATVVAGGAEATELAGEIGRVVGVAANLGVSFEEVGAFIATYTRLGISASEATTGLSGVLNTILSPSKEAKDALDGIGLSADMLRQMVAEKGLGAALGVLIQKLDGNAEATGALFGNVRALAGVLGTAGVQGAGYKAVLEQIQHSTGNLNGAFEETKKTFGSQWKEFKAQAEVLAITLGTQLLPAATGLLQAAKPLGNWLVQAVGWFAQLPQPVQTGTLAFLGLVAALGPVSYAIGTVLSSVSALIAGFRLIGGVTAFDAAMRALQPVMMGAQMGIASLYAVAAAHPFVAVTLAIGGMIFALGKINGAVTNAMSAFKQNGWAGVWGEIGRNVNDDSMSFGKAGRVDQLRRDGGSGKSSDVNLGAAGSVQDQEAIAALADRKAAAKTAAAATTAAAKQAAEAWQKVDDQMTGKAAIAAAADMMSHVRAGTRLTDEATKRLATTLGEALAAYALLGKTAPQAMVDTWIATMETVKVTNGIQPGQFGEALKLPTVPEIPIPNLPKIEEGGLFGDILANPTVPALRVATPFREAFNQLGKDLPGMIFGALQNGGSVVGAIGAGIGAQFSKQFQSALEKAGGDLSKVSGSNKALGVAGSAIGAAFTGYDLGAKLGKGKGALAGAAAGASMGAVAGPWGAAIGAGVGAIAGFFGGRKKDKEAKAQMEEQRAEILKQYGGMDKLKSMADSLGVSLGNAFSTKKPEEFRAAIDKLNVAVEAHKTKLEGISQIVEGVNARGKVFADSLKTNADGTAAGPGNQADFNRVGAMALGGFGAEMSNGGSALATLQLLKPTLDALNQAQGLYNFTASETTQRLLDINNAVNANLPAFQALEADGTILNGMLKANWADMGLFAATSSDVAAQIAAITAGGMPMAQALGLNQPVLQALWEAQQQFGFAADEATQALIDQAVTQGIVGPQMKDVNKQILDVLLAIGKVLGADIPTALAGLPGAAASAAKGMNDAFGRVTPPGVGDGYTGPTGDLNDMFPGQFHPGQNDVMQRDIPALAAGGLVSRKTLAWIGEAGPEVVVPLADFSSMLGAAVSPLPMDDMRARAVQAMDAAKAAADAGLMAAYNGAGRKPSGDGYDGSGINPGGMYTPGVPSMDAPRDSQWLHDRMRTGAAGGGVNVHVNVEGSLVHQDELDEFVAQAAARGIRLNRGGAFTMMHAALGNA